MWRQVIHKPSYVLSYLRSDKPIPDLTVPNVVVGNEPAPTFFGAYGSWM
jgi:L-lactate dehydrogenase (cytochrome)